MMIGVFLICFLASVVGDICGIGGGVVIKPVLDAFGILDVTTISFLSGCTVLSMTAYSVIRSFLSGKSRIDQQIGLPLALGAAIGGLIGKQLFQSIRMLFSYGNQVGAVQAGCLLIVTVGTLIYTLRKSEVKTKSLKHPGICLVIGLALGIMSSFLGIGGGPINLVVLFYFFSMDTRTAAENSIYIILFSQIASLLLSVITNTVPEFSIGMLCLMVGGGMCGGVCGRAVNRRISEKNVDHLFIGLMVLIIGINVWNIAKYCRVF